MTSLTVPMFNPFAFAKRLKDVGVPEPLADAEAEILHEALAQQAQVVSALESEVAVLKENVKRDAEQMATKADIAGLKTDIELLNAKVDSKISDVRKEITIARRDTIIWLGGMLIAGFGSVITLLLRFSG